MDCLYWRPDFYGRRALTNRRSCFKSGGSVGRLGLVGIWYILVADLGNLVLVEILGVLNG